MAKTVTFSRREVAVLLDYLEDGSLREEDRNLLKWKLLRLWETMK